MWERANLGENGVGNNLCDAKAMLRSSKPDANTGRRHTVSTLQQ
jgi:hypothetical protein